MPATNVSWPVPLTRLNPWYPGQFGVPGTDSETGLRLDTEGCIFWVDPNHPDANDNRDGTNPTSPLATVGAAIGKCAAYRGDVIAVMHNGFWTYGDMTASNITPIQEAVTVNVPGVRLSAPYSANVDSGSVERSVTSGTLACMRNAISYWAMRDSISGSSSLSN